MKSDSREGRRVKSEERREKREEFHQPSYLSHQPSFEVGVLDTGGGNRTGCGFALRAIVKMIKC